MNLLRCTDLLYQENTEKCTSCPELFNTLHSVTSSVRAMCSFHGGSKQWSVPNSLGPEADTGVEFSQESCADITVIITHLFSRNTPGMEDERGCRSLPEGTHCSPVSCCGSGPKTSGH